MAVARPVGAIIFDLDDTLYPEIAFVRSGFRAVAAAFASELGPGERQGAAGDTSNIRIAHAQAKTLDRATRANPGPADVLFEALWAVFNSPDRHRVFDAVIAQSGRPADADLVSRMVAAYRAHSPDIRLHADAERALARLAGRVPLGLISDGYLITQQNKIDALRLRPRLAAIVLTDERGREFWKPHPWGFEQAAARLSNAIRAAGLEGLPPAYVSDNPAKDFVAPNRMGWTTIQIRRPDGVYRDTPAAAGGAPNHTIASLDELAEWC